MLKIIPVLLLPLFLIGCTRQEPETIYIQREILATLAKQNNLIEKETKVLDSLKTYFDIQNEKELAQKKHWGM